MRVIPAIDIIEGKCVRLTKGNYTTKKIYSESPLEVAKQFEAHGIKHLHLVDLDGAKSGKVVNYGILEMLASKTSLQIDFGGGVSSDKDLQIVFNSGASQVTGGSIAVRSPEIFTGWLKKYGSEKIILGTDFSKNKIAIDGWEKESEQELFQFIGTYLDQGIRYTVCTDISKDGMLEGPSFKVYERIVHNFPELKLIASGGVSRYEDLFELAEIGCEGVIIGKAIYEKRLSLKQLELYILNNQ